jgi:hypothetical protein
MNEGGGRAQTLSGSRAHGWVGKARESARDVRIMRLADAVNV